MREVVVRVAAEALEAVLDRLLVIAPDGARQAPLPDGRIELRLRGPRLPATEVLRTALEGIEQSLDEQTVSDDWRIRRRADYRPQLIGGRLIVRPAWAPRPPAGVIDIVLEESAAFGAGTHPTTRACLEHLLELAPQRSFADLGCGSGVLAILAARLGAASVSACDVNATSVAATAHNATANGVELEIGLLDLLTEAPPRVEAFAANVPADVHLAITRGWAGGEVPADGIITGLGAADADRVLGAYRSIGLAARRRDLVHGWVVCRLGR